MGAPGKAACSPWLDRMARWGLAVRGGLYLVVALLAVRVATGSTGGNGDRADKQGALAAVARQPLGRLLLVVAAIGFVGYAIWRFTEAVVGPPDEDDARKATIKRIGAAARGLLYCAFFASAVRFVVSANETASSKNAEADWTARVLGWPGGAWIVALVGAAVIGGGLYVGWRGITEKFKKRLKQGQMNAAERRWIGRLGLVGMVARMVVFTLIGIFLITAARQHDPSEAVGIDGALKRLAARSFGAALLTVVALGLAAYGLYSLAEARYRKVETG